MPSTKQKFKKKKTLEKIEGLQTGPKHHDTKLFVVWKACMAVLDTKLLGLLE